MSVQSLYSPESFLDLLKEYVANGLYYQDFFEHYDEQEVLEIGKYIKAERDMDYGYTSILMYKKRYLLNPNGVIKELPQHMYMAVAMFLAIPENKQERVHIACEFYDLISEQKLSLATPTLMNARRRFHQLSSCFVLTADDDLR